MNPTYDFEGQIALVTGASAGIGLATANAFANAGAAVVFSDVKADMLREATDAQGRSEEIAASVLWLCSPGASFVVGAALAVDGGFTAH